MPVPETAVVAKRLTRDQVEDIVSRAAGTVHENDVKALAAHAEAMYQDGHTDGLEEQMFDVVDADVYEALRKGVRDLVWRIRSGLLNGDTAIAQALEGLEGD